MVIILKKAVIKDEINAEYKNDNLRIVIPKMKTKIGNKINIR